MIVLPHINKMARAGGETASVRFELFCQIIEEMLLLDYAEISIQHADGCIDLERNQVVKKVKWITRPISRDEPTIKVYRDKIINRYMLTEQIMEWMNDSRLTCELLTNTLFGLQEEWKNKVEKWSGDTLDRIWYELGE